MSRFILIFTLIFILFVPPVFAQTAQKMDLGTFIENIISGLSENKIPDTLQNINNAALPYEVQITPGSSQTSQNGTIDTTTSNTTQTQNVKGAQTTINSDPLSNAIINYNVAADKSQPYDPQTNKSFDLSTIFQTFFSNVLTFFGIGNQKASDYAQGILPANITSNSVLSTQSTHTTTDTSTAMLNSLPVVECGSLPLDACKNILGSQKTADNTNPVVSTSPPDVSPISQDLTPTSFPTQQPEPTPIFTCDQSIAINPTRSPQEIQNNICQLGKGDCSVGCLLKYFGNDVGKAKIASRICQRESGSWPGATNFHCLDGKSVDYSVGLYQINLLPSDRCPGAFSGYTWHPPSCTIQNQQVLNACVEDLKNPDTNISKMVSMSGGGTSWGDWKSPNGCQLE